MNKQLNQAIKYQIKQIADKCLDKLSLFALDKDEVDYYINEYLKPYISEQPLYWYTNPLVKVIKEHIGNELPICFLSLIDKIEASREFNEALEREKIRYLNVLNNDLDINSEECEELLVLMKIDDRFPISLVINFILKKIIQKKLVLEDDLYQRIFLEYIKAQEKVSSKRFCAFFKNIPDEIRDGIVYTTDAEVLEQNGVTYVRFNRKHFKCENILLNLFVFYHEKRHIFQESDEETSEYLRELFMMDKYLNSNKSGYKRNNYRFLSYEADANLYGCINLYQYLLSFGILDYQRDILEAMISFNNLRYSRKRIDQYGREVLVDQYFVHLTQKNGDSFNIDILSGMNDFRNYEDPSRYLAGVMKLMRSKELEAA